jgi:hypothetical protein
MHKNITQIKKQFSLFVVNSKYADVELFCFMLKRLKNVSYNIGLEYFCKKICK